MSIFLDSNAHMAMNASAMRAFVDFNNTLANHGNPMALGRPGREASNAIEAARTKIAELLGATSSSQIVFTSTCTQACEWALELIKARKFQNIFTSPFEHVSIRHSFNKMFPNGKELTVSKEGVVSVSFPPPQNSFFICLHAHNEIGTLQKIEEIQAPFFSDMSQSLGRIPINLSSLPNLALATFGAHKFGGPTGVGILYIKDSSWWKEFGSSNRYYFDRSGTPDAASIVATAAALDETIKTLPKRYEQMVRFKNVVENEIQSIGLKIIGSGAVRIPSTTFVKIGNKMGPYLMHQLEADGIFIGLGSACSAMDPGLSSNYSVTRLGYGGSAHDFFRISHFGEYAEQQGFSVAKALRKYCPKLNDLP